VPVNTVEHYPSSNSIPADAYYPTSVALEAAYHQACTNGHPPRVLLLSHPQNPLGICYPADVVLDCIGWCRYREVHLISDEIYAGSVYRETDTSNQQNDGVASFTSSLALCSGQQSTAATNQVSADVTGFDLGPFVHLVYAFSKDFGLSGLRVGVCYTENKEILLPLQKLNDLCQISSQTQVLVEAMLTKRDEQGVYWTDLFLKENQKRLRQRGDALEAVFTEFQIPFLKASAGLFLWIDLSEFLPATGTNEERERKLYLELLEHGLLLTPGLSMRHPLPGFFRCVFTAANDEEFRLSLSRIRHFIQQRRGEI
jgi:aspartate/methionine/tyrosine aminotransferase